MMDDDDGEFAGEAEPEERVPAMETPLDLAFERARSDPEETAAFYDTLFAATVFMPIDGAFDEDGNASETEARAIAPILYEVENVPTLMVFDTEDRLARWTDEPVDYVGLSGAQFFAMFEGEQQVALNIGVAPSSVVIPVDTVSWLHDRAVEAVESEEIPPGAALELAPPPELSTEAVARITARIAGLRREIDEAVFFTLGTDLATEEGIRRVVLGVALSDAGVADAEAVAHALAETARGVFEGERQVEIALLSAESELMEKARAVGLIVPVVQVGMLH